MTPRIDARGARTAEARAMSCGAPRGEVDMTTRTEVVFGLGFGDEGKGTKVDRLARRAVDDGVRALPVVRRGVARST